MSHPDDRIVPPSAPAAQPAGPRQSVPTQSPAQRVAGPRSPATQSGPQGVSFQQLDPGYTYQVDVYDGTTWGKIGEIWAPTNQGEVWGLYQDWATYAPGPVALYITVLGSSSSYGSLAAFETAITSQDPNGKPQFWESKKL